MAITQIGYNVSNINATVDFNLPNSSTTILEQIPAVANTLTNHWLGYIIGVGMFIIYYVTLADKTPLAEFGYSDIRAFGISMGFVSVLLMTMLDIAFITNAKAVAFFVVLFVIVGTYISFNENA